MWCHQEGVPRDLTRRKENANVNNGEDSREVDSAQLTKGQSSNFWSGLWEISLAFPNQGGNYDTIGYDTIQCRLTGTIRYNMIQYDTPYSIVPVGKFVFDSNDAHITALTYTYQNNKKHNPILHITESCTYHNIIQRFYRVWYNLGLSLLKETKDNRKSRKTSSFWLLKETNLWGPQIRWELPFSKGNADTPKKWQNLSFTEKNFTKHTFTKTPRLLRFFLQVLTPYLNSLVQKVIFTKI